MSSCNLQDSCMIISGFHSIPNLNSNLQIRYFWSSFNFGIFRAGQGGDWGVESEGGAKICFGHEKQQVPTKTL